MNYKRLKKKLKSFTGVSVILFIIIIIGFWIYASFRLDEGEKDDEALLSDSNLASIESFFVEGKILFKNERYSQAEEMFQRVLTLQSKNFLAIEWSARCQEKMDHRDIAQQRYLKVISINPKQYYSHYRLSMFYFVNMSWQKSKKHAEIFVIAPELKNEALGILAGCALFQRKIDVAKEYLQKVDNHSINIVKYINSCFLVDNKKYQEARTELLTIKEELSELATLKIVEIYFLEKKTADAELLLEKIQYSNYLGIKLAYLQLCLQNNYSNKANRMITTLIGANLSLDLMETFATMLFLYDQDDYVFSYIMDLLKKHKNNPILNFVVMQIFLKKRAFLQAEEYIPIIIENSQSQEIVIKTYKIMFGLLFIKYKMEKALLCAQKLIAKYPQEAFGYMYQSQVFIAQEKHEEALSSYQNGFKNTIEKTMFKICIMNVYMLQKDWKKAGIMAKEMIANNEEVAKAKTLLATVYLQLGQKEKSRKMYEELFSESQNSPVAANNLAMMIADQGGDLEYAEKLAIFAVNKTNSPLVWDTLSWVYIKRQKLQEAKEILDSLIGNFRENIDINYHYAVLMKKLNHFDIAKEKFLLVIELEPDSEYAQLALDEVRKIDHSKKEK